MEEPTDQKTSESIPTLPSTEPATSTPMSMSTEPGTETPAVPQFTTPEEKSVPPGGSSKMLKILLLIGLPLIVILSASAWLLFANKKTEPTTEVSVTPTVTVTPQKLSLSISSPADGDVSTDEKVTVSGMTLPNTTVLVFTDGDSNSVDSNSTGKFEAEVTLTEGINTITATAVSSAGEELSTTVDIVYEGQVKGTSSVSSGSKVLGKATVGNVKEVKSNSVTLTDKKTNKQTQVGVDSKTQIVDENNKNIKVNTIKLDSKVAIVASDSATVATGSATKNASKIYVKQIAAGGQKRNAVSGVVTNIAGNVITLSHLIQRDRIFTLTTTEATVIKMKGVAAPTLANLVLGMRIAAVGDTDADGNLVVVRIHVIPGNATGAFKNPFPTGSATPSATVSVSPTSSVSGTPAVTIEPSETPTPTP